MSVVVLRRWLPAVFLGVACLAADPEGAPMTVVRPEDTGAELRNPGMGWMLHYYDNVPANYGSRLAPADTLDQWPGLNLVYLRIPWSLVEPAPGVFHWSVLDTPMQRFAARGIPAAFRFSCSESWMEYATPRWVESAGARGYRFQPGKGIVADGPFWEPDYDDPVFLAKLEHFLAVVAQRYDGHPDVAYVDVGSFGVWGEGHTWSSTGKAYPTATIERHIELHLKYFRKTTLMGMDDFVSRPGSALPLAVGRQTRGFDLVVPLAWRGRSFALYAGLWEPGRQEHLGRLVPRRDQGERRTLLGRLSVAADGSVTVPPDDSAGAFTPAPTAPAEFDLCLAGIRYDRERQPHSLKLDVEIAVREAPSSRVQPFLHLVDPESGRELCTPPEEREDEGLTRFMAERGLGLRDDSILVQPPPAAYFHARMAQSFWPRQAVVLESEHYGGSAQRGCWQDGSAFLQAVEDYHASYVSIHWWPHEFLEANRDLVRRLNQRLGYRFLPATVRFPPAVPLGAPFPVSWQWRNAGVAPPYRDAFPALTLKDAAGGLAAVLVDSSLNLRTVAVAALGEAPASSSEVVLPLPFQLAAGEYSVYVSAGDALGRPLLALPLADDDGQRRYLVGRCRITAAFAVHLSGAVVRGDQAVLDLAWRVHAPLPAGAVPFFHLEQAGKLLRASGPAADAAGVADLHQAGEHPLQVTLSLAGLGAVGEIELLAGLWQPERLGQDDERLIPDADRGDRRVLLGRLRLTPDQSATLERP